MSRAGKYIILAVALAVSALLVVQYVRLLGPAQIREVEAACIGMRPSPDNPKFGPLASDEVFATDFTLKNSEGEEVSLSDFKGRVVIVNFWASWCSVCRSEKPSLESLQADHDDEEITVLALASDRDWAPVRRAMFGFEVASASEVLAQPDVYGVRDAASLPATGDQMVIVRIDRGRAAERSGMRRLDRITRINGVEIENAAALDEALRSASGTIELTVSHLDRTRPDALVETRTVELSENSKLHVLLDPPDDDGNLGAIAKKYGISAVPESFVIDRDGKIRHYYINKRNWDGDVAGTCLQDLIDG